MATGIISNSKNAGLYYESSPTLTLENLVDLLTTIKAGETYMVRTGTALMDELANSGSYQGLGLYMRYNTTTAYYFVFSISTAAIGRINLESKTVSNKNIIL